MPRGHLKRKATVVGRKKARGGRSHQPLYSRTPAWVREDKKRNTSNKQKWRVVGQDQYNDYLENQYDDPLRELWTDGCGSVPASDSSNADAVVPDGDADDSSVPLGLLSFSALSDEKVESDSNVENEGESLFEASVDHAFSLCDESKISSFSFCDETKISKAGSSFVLCDDTNLSASFCLVWSQNGHGANADASSLASSLWDFVAPTIGDVVARDAPVNSVAHHSLDDCSVSVISQLQEPSLAPLEQLSEDQRCTICLEDKPSTLRIMQRCCHPAACFDCLRTHYIKHQIEDDSNFPLRCFWPDCTRVMRDAQIRQLVQSLEEMEFYYYQANLAKYKRKQSKRRRLEEAQYKHLQERRIHNLKVRQSCGECTSTQTVYPGRDEGLFHCQQCEVEQPIDVISADEIRMIVDLHGDDLVNCPYCEVLICKAGGCDHMTCICEREFSFQVAQTELRKALPFPVKKSRVVSFKGI